MIDSETGPSMCYNCERKRPDVLTCKAFPDGIPDEILFGAFDHRKPFKGDGGVRYLPINPAVEPGPFAAASESEGLLT